MAADNWAWDSVATKQRSLSNEINDVVLGLVSPRRGLSPNSPPKVKERTITQTEIHQAHSELGQDHSHRRKGNLLRKTALLKAY